MGRNADNTYTWRLLPRRPWAGQPDLDIHTFLKCIWHRAHRSLYIIENFLIDLTNLAYPFHSLLMWEIEDFCQAPVQMVRDKGDLCPDPVQRIGHCHPPGPGSSGGRFSSP